MPAVIIISSVLLLVALLSVLPLSLSFRLDGDFTFKIRYAGITVYKTKPEDGQTAVQDGEKSEPTKRQEKSFFKKLTDKKGFTGAVKEVFGLLSAVFSCVGKTLKRLKIKRFVLDIVVASDDAASTAISYGAVCSAVYPVLTLLSTAVGVKLKNVSITADFNATNPDFKLSADISVALIFLLVSAFGILKEYNNFKTRNEL